MKTPLVLSLYVIIDVDYLASIKKEPVFALRSVLKGGATAIQLRAKHMEDGKYLNLAKKLFAICKKSGVPFIINDRVDIACVISADGVHVGAGDMPVMEVKKIMDRSKIIGVSASGIKESIAADKLGADYIGIGPVFATGQKDKKPMGIKAMEILMKKLRTPVVAIGGINGYNIPQLKKSGVKNFSFISAALGASDIVKSTKLLKGIITLKEKI